MKIFNPIFAIMFILIAVLVAGCLSSQQVQCPIQNNITPWITINPIGEHFLGDSIEINGTTDIDRGEVKLLIKDDSDLPCPKNRGPPDYPCACCEGVNITAPIKKGICGINTWAVILDTSQHHFDRGEYGLWAVSNVSPVVRTLLELK